MNDDANNFSTGGYRRNICSLLKWYKKLNSVKTWQIYSQNELVRFYGAQCTANESFETGCSAVFAGEWAS